MPSNIITLDPQQYGDAHATRKVESVARRLRYRALGRECRDQGIANLLFAHHADDQAETTLMRLANNYLGSGLAGMRCSVVSIRYRSPRLRMSACSLKVAGLRFCDPC